MRQHLSGLGRATATLLVVLWALQPVALWVHAGEHTHRYCAEHRTFEEGQARSAGGALSAAPEASAMLRLAPAASSENPGVRPHEACALPTCGPRDPAVLGAAGPLHARATGTQPAAPPLALAPAPPLSVLDVAPKASPPARA